jgi:MFS transporter, ACS family, glucarate transporter
MQPERPTRVRWLIFLLACAASWLLYLHRYAWGVIKPAFRKENAFTDTEIGWIDAAFNAAYAVGQVPGGLAGDVYGPRAVLSTFILGWSLAAAGVAWTAGFWRLCGVRALFGLTQAGAYPVLNKMTRTWFPLSIRTSVQGLIAAMGRLGAASCPVILATVLMGLLHLPWQTSLLILALPGVVLAGAWWVVVRNSPLAHPAVNAAEQELIDFGMVPSVPGARVVLHLNRASLLSLTAMLVYAFTSTFQDQIYVYWISEFLTEGRGLTTTEMGLFTPLPLLGGALGGILGGVLNDVLLRKTGNRRWTRSGVGFTGKLIAAGMVLLSVQVADGRLAMVILFATRIFGDWSLPTQWGAITDMGGRAAATLFGLVNMVGAAGGFVAGPALGFLKQHHGWEGLFLGVAAMNLLAALTWLFIDCTRRLVAD